MWLHTRNESTDGIFSVQKSSDMYIALVVALGSIALLIFAFRIYTCAKLQRKFGIDDWTALIAALSIVGIIVCFANAANVTFWKSSWNQSQPENYTSSGLNWYSALTLLYIIGIGSVKISIALFLVRVFPRGYVRYISSGFAVLLAVSTAEWFTTALVRCISVPTVQIAQPQFQKRHMSPSTYGSLDLVNNFINCTSTILFVAALLATICTTHLKLWTRLYLICALCLGLTAGTAALFRTCVIFNEWKAGQYYDQKDIMFTIWSVVELTSGLTASCVPLTGSFAKSFHPSSHASNPRPSHHPSTPPTLPTISTHLLPPFSPPPIPTSSSSPQPSSSLTQSARSVRHKLSNMIKYSLLSPLDRAKTSVGAGFSANSTRFHDEAPPLDFDFAMSQRSSPISSSSRTPTLGTKVMHCGGGGGGGGRNSNTKEGMLGSNMKSGRPGAQEHADDLSLGLERCEPDTGSEAPRQQGAYMWRGIPEESRDRLAKTLGLTADEIQNVAQGLAYARQMSSSSWSGNGSASGGSSKEGEIISEKNDARQVKRTSVLGHAENVSPVPHMGNIFKGRAVGNAREISETRQTGMLGAMTMPDEIFLDSLRGVEEKKKGRWKSGGGRGVGKG